MSEITKQDSQLKQVTWRFKLGGNLEVGTRMLGAAWTRNWTCSSSKVRQVTCSGGNCCPDIWIEVPKVMVDKKLHKTN